MKKIMLEQQFISERKKLGKGAQANIYFWNGFAYKVFHNNYPKKWINYEIQIQNTVCKTKLPVVKYYQSAFANSIKMDYMDGVTLAEKIRE